MRLQKSFNDGISFQSSRHFPFISGYNYAYKLHMGPIGPKHLAHGPTLFVNNYLFLSHYRIAAFGQLVPRRVYPVISDSVSANAMGESITK
jgi:hypothetical protein